MIGYWISHSTKFGIKVNNLLLLPPTLKESEELKDPSSNPGEGENINKLIHIS